MTKSEQNTLRKRNTAIKKRYERRYTKPFYLALREQKAAVIAAAKQDIHAAYAQISLISPDPLMKEYKRMYYKVVPHEADREYARLASTKAFGVNIDWLADIEAFLNDYMLNNIVRPMTARTMERMYRSLNTGIATGMSNDEIIKSLEDTGEDVKRARLIARTEATRAAEFASHMGANQHDFKVKRVWISAHDKRTRGAPTPDGVDDKSDHYHMNGMEVGEGELFTDPRNGAKYLFPGDSTNGAGPENVCNCRCSCGYEGVRDADGNLIMRDSPKPVQGRVKPLMPQMPEPIQQPVKPTFTPAKNVKEAEDWAAKNLKTKIVSYQGYNIEVANTINNALLKAESSFVTVPNTQINSGVSGRAYAQFDWGKNEILIRKNYRDIEQRQQLDNETWAKRYPNSESFHAGTGLENTVFHEFGHAWDYATSRSLYKEISQLDIQIQNRAYGVSGYASSDRIGGFSHSRGAEMIAELVTAKLSGSKSYERLPIEIRQIVDKYFK